MATSNSNPQHHRFSFPADYSPVQPFTLQIPDGWTAQDASGCVLALLAPAEKGTFRANLTISVDHVAKELDLAAVAAKTLSEAQEEAIQFQLEDEKVVTVAGSPASLRIQTFQPDQLRYRILQTQLLFFAPERVGAGKELFTIIGSCLADDGDLYIDEFAFAGMTFEFPGNAP